MEEVLFFLEMWYYMVMMELEMEGYQFLEYVDNYWGDVYPSLNPGQSEIFGNYLIEFVEEWLEEVEDNWLLNQDPFSVELEEYIDGCYTCFDSDVMVRAFSDSIDSPLDEMQDRIDSGIELQMEGEMIQFLMGDFF